MPTDPILPMDPILIVGGGWPAWLAATVLARALRRAAPRIRVVDCGGGPDDAGVLAPAGIELALKLGIAETAMLANGGSHVLGTVLSRDGAARFVSLAPAGAPFGPIPFHQLAAWLGQHDQPTELANHSFNAMCAQAGRFAVPGRNEHGVAASLEYGVSFDPRAWAASLRDEARALGISHHPTREVAWQADAAGRVQGVVLDHGEELGAALVIDARVNGEGEVRDAGTGAAPALFVHLEADAASWHRHTPLGKRASSFASAADPDKVTGPAWNRGVVDLGLAWRGVDRLAGLGPQLLLSMLVRLLGLLPATRADSIEAAEYNRLTAAELAAARDYAAQLLSHPGAISPQLERKRSVYAETGRVPMFDEEPVSESDWINLFAAQGLAIRHPDRQLTGVPLADLAAHAARLRTIMIEGLRAMPPYLDPAGIGR